MSNATKEALNQQIETALKEARLEGYKEGFRVGYSHALQNLSSNIQAMFKSIIDDRFNNVIEMVLKQPSKPNLHEDRWCDFTDWSKLKTHDKFIIVTKIAGVLLLDDEEFEFTFKELKHQLFNGGIEISYEVINKIVEDNLNLFNLDNSIAREELATINGTEYLSMWWDVIKPIWLNIPTEMLVPNDPEHEWTIIRLCALAICDESPANIKDLQRHMKNFNFNVDGKLVPILLKYSDTFDRIRKDRAWGLTKKGENWVRSGCKD